MHTCEMIVTSVARISLTILLLLYSTYDYDGCLGGFPLTGYGYVAKAGGLTTEALYPYDVMTSYCDKSKNNFAVTVTMAYKVDGEQAMINQVLAGRTLSVAVDANQWGPYKSGIFSGCSVDYQVNHAVNIVGVNVPEGYWIVRNSWGSWWGDKGYMKVKMVRGHSRCIQLD
jgi:C1A family cysteine protease